MLDLLEGVQGVSIFSAHFKLGEFGQVLLDNIQRKRLIVKDIAFNIFHVRS
jgi:hypothetical protein